MKKLLVLLFSVCLLYPAAADFGASQLDLPSKDVIPGPELYINHRFFGPVNNDPLTNMFGEDFGANMSLGFGMPLNDRTEVSGYRSVQDKTYQLYSKFRLNDQGTFFLGVTDKTAPGINRNRTNGIIGGVFNLPLKAVNLGITPMMVMADDSAYTVGLTANLPLRDDLQAIVEYVPVLGSQTGRFPTLSAGIKFRIAVHYFTLLLTNNVYSSCDEVIRGSMDNVVHFGFNIVVMFL